MSTLSVIKAVIHACRGLLLTLLITFGYSCCMVNSSKQDCYLLQKPSSSLRFIQSLLHHHSRDTTPHRRFKKLKNAARQDDPLSSVALLFYTASRPERLTSGIVYTPDNSENENSSSELTNRKRYGAQKYDRKTKKKDTCRARKYAIGASDHSHTQKKKLHGQGNKNLEPLDVSDMIKKDVQELIEQQQWENNFETHIHITAAERLQRKSDEGTSCQPNSSLAASKRERLTSRIIYTPDDSENEGELSEFTNRKRYGAQKYDRKAKKKDTCRARKYAIDASDNSHTQKKKLHGQGNKSLEPLDAGNIIRQDVQELIEQQQWENDFETRTYLAAVQRLKKKTADEQYQSVKNALDKPCTLSENISFSFFSYCQYISSTLASMEDLPTPKFLGATTKHLGYVAGTKIVHIPLDNREQIEILSITK